MKKELYIIGAGSVGGHIALNIEEYSAKYQIKGFLDDDPSKVGTQKFGFDVIGKIDKALGFDNVAIVVGIAFPKVKRQLLKKLSSNSSLIYPTLIHTKAWISKNVTMGKGCIIYPGTTINFKCNIQDFAVINANCSLGHHTLVGKYSSFAPGVSTGGHTIIEEAVDMGIGVSTLQNIRIGRESKVGGQSMVINPVKTKSVVAGVPAQTISR
jgi:sugar O-acyltransferase (sialic acid O-acetyltransferase NeuD family)